jgi:hypothetical protein
MRYVVARYNVYVRETTYRICVTDSLRITSKNTADYVGGTYFTARYADLIKPKEKEEQEERTAEDVINHIKQGLERL